MPLSDFQLDKKPTMDDFDYISTWMKEAFENIVIENHKEANVQIFEYTNKVPEFMSISNLVVTKPGGLTTSESLASGLPIVVINPIPGQEEENAEYLVNHNTAIWLKKMIM